MTTIQIRRIGEKINRYFRKFGYRTHTEYQNTKAQIKAGKDLGLDQIECKITETSRGTAIGFYPKNTWTNFLVFFPFAIGIILTILRGDDRTKSIATLNGYIDLKTLFLGKFEFSFLSVTIMVLIPLIFSLMSYSFQQIRLNFIKIRFSFFTKDANWNPSDLTPTMISLKSAQTAFFHGWLLAVVYFSVFAMPDSIMNDVLSLYSIDQNTLYKGVTEGFLIISGALVGLVSADKANKLRKMYSAQDKALRMGSGLTLRRVESMLYSLTSALFAGVFYLGFLSVTYIDNIPVYAIVFHILGYFVAAIIGGYIREEGVISFVTAYGAIMLFFSLGLVFRTGTEPAFAFVVIIQLLMIPLSFLLIANRGIDPLLASNKIRTVDHMYQILPVNIFVTLYLMRSRQRRRRIQYEKSLEEDTVITDDEGQLIIDKSIISKKGGEIAILVAKHYFELLTWYTSSFDEDKLILIPTPKELMSYWSERTKRQPNQDSFNFLAVADRLIWDTLYIPDQEELRYVEKVGKQLALELR